MFLKKIYHYNKWMFALMILFIIIQLSCFIKKGMVFSPWYNYGMYSEVIKPQITYEVTRVYADGQLLKGNEYSPQDWDRIHYNLQLAAAVKCNETFYDHEISRIFAKFHLPVPSEKHYINNKYSADVTYLLNRRYLAQWLEYKTVSVYPQRYSWDGSKLIFKDSLKTISSSSFLCQ